MDKTFTYAEYAQSAAAQSTNDVVNSLMNHCKKIYPTDGLLTPELVHRALMRANPELYTFKGAVCLYSDGWTAAFREINRAVRRKPAYRIEMSNWIKSCNAKAA